MEAVCERQRKVDWSRSFLEPVHCDFTDDGIRFSAAGEEICFKGSILSFTPSCADANIRTSKRVENLITLLTDVHIARTDVVQLVTWFDGAWSGYDSILDYQNGASSICTFMRKGAVSFFISLDFPYSQIEKGRISYDPFDSVIRDETYEV